MPRTNLSISPQALDQFIRVSNSKILCKRRPEATHSRLWGLSVAWRQLQQYYSSGSFSQVQYQADQL